MKEQLFGFWMDMSKILEPNLVELWRISNDFSNIEKGLSDENLFHLLLHNLSDSYLEAKTGHKYGRYDISLNLVIFHMRIWELELKKGRLHIGGSKSDDNCIRGQRLRKKPSWVKVPWSKRQGEMLLV